MVGGLVEKKEGNIPHKLPSNRETFSPAARKRSGEHRIVLKAASAECYRCTSVLLVQFVMVAFHRCQDDLMSRHLRLELGLLRHITDPSSFAYSDDAAVGLKYTCE